MSIRSLLKLNQGFETLVGSLKVIFIKVSQNFIKIPLKILPNLTEISSQLMACMLIAELHKNDIHIYSDF